MLSLIYSDGIDNPIDGVEFPEEVPEYKKYIPFEQLEEARELVAAELPEVIKEFTFTEENYEKGRKHVKLDFGKKEAKIMEGEVKNQR